MQALGGAKNHAVVLPDADLDLAADGLVSAAYGSAGQRCMAVSVAVAVGDVAEPLLAKVQERIDDADGRRRAPTPASDMGPLVSERHRERVAGLVDAGVDGGRRRWSSTAATCVVEGHEGGYFLGPCCSTTSGPACAIYDEEIFGPVLVVVRADSYPEALELVNANPYGNGAAIFTNDGGAARAFEQEVTAGMVGVNVPIPVPMAYHSFGGWKASLFGDLHIHGPDGVRFYTRGKVVTRRWPDPARTAASTSASRRRRSVLRAQGRDLPRPVHVHQLQGVLGGLLARRGRPDLGRGVGPVDVDGADRQPRVLDLVEALLERALARQAELLDVLDEVGRQQTAAHRLVVLRRSGAAELADGGADLLLRRRACVAAPDENQQQERRSQEPHGAEHRMGVYGGV